MIDSNLPPTRPSTLPSTDASLDRPRPTLRPTHSSIAGRYRLIRSIGVGGHAEVWEALDSLSASRVAIKLLGASQGPERARVRREVAALRRLRVPGVVHLLDEGIDGDTAYLAMELIDGLPFPGLPTPSPWSVLEPITLALLETLARIHALGLVHRDLKPGNILVRADGLPTILDFGIAFGGLSGTSPLTANGEVLGTPAYLAPEQITGQPCSAATDLYSVGVMLFEALTGRLPHTSNVIQGTFYARLNNPAPSLHPQCTNAPDHVCRALASMLAIEPEDRPHSATHAIELLRGHTDRLSLTPSLPRLGHDCLEQLLHTVLNDRPVDLVGAHGTGRSRLLDDLAFALTQHHRTVVRTTAAHQPFASLEPLIGPLDPHAESNLDAVIHAVHDNVSARLRDGVVLLVDDADTTDVWSAEVIDRLRYTGPVVRVFLPDGHCDPTTSLTLTPLTESDLLPLFRGPERLFHLPSDASRSLFSRTNGHPARVHAELAAWRRAGLVHLDDDQYVINRDTLDRLDAHTRLMPPVRSSGHGFDLPRHLGDLLRWISLSWPNGSIELLATAMSRPRWRIAAEAEELIRRGFAQRTSDGHLEPLRTTLPEQNWSFSDHLSAHRALASALPSGTVGRLHHVLAGGPATDSLADRFSLAQDIVREAVRFCLLRARAGGTGHATAILSESLLGVRELTDESPTAELLTPLLALWAEIALSDGTPQAIDRVLYEISKLTPRTVDLDRLDSLLRAALALGQGGERAKELCQSITPFADPWLERRRLGIQVLAARQCSVHHEESVLSSLEVNSRVHRDAVLRNAHAGWLGRLRYRQHRFSEAMALHDSAAENEPWLALRIDALINAASSAMEAFDLDAAATRALRARDLAADCRLPYYEARAEWVLRSSAYRSHRALSVDHELIEAVRLLGMVNINAMIHLNEAAVAWRLGELTLARSLADEAWRSWHATAWQLGEVLACSMAIACGKTFCPSSIDDLLSRIVACGAPRIALQSLALIVTAHPDRHDSLRALASPFIGMVPEAPPTQRLEVLSITEVRELLSFTVSDRASNTVETVSAAIA